MNTRTLGQCLVYSILLLVAACSSGGAPEIAFETQAGAYGQLKVKDSGKCLQDSGNVTEVSCDGGADQQWRQLAAPNGYFALQNRRTGECLDVYKNSRSDRANVSSYRCESLSSGDGNQLLKIRSTSGSQNVLEFKHSRKCLDVKSDGNAIQYACHGNSNQQFVIPGSDNASPSPTPSPTPSPDPSPSPDAGLAKLRQSGKNFYAGSKPIILNYYALWGMGSLDSNADVDYAIRKMKSLGYNSFGYVTWGMGYYQSSTCVDNAGHPNIARNDLIVRKAKEHGLYVQMIHGWGDHTRDYKSKANAIACIKFMGNRYKNEAHVFHSVTNEYTRGDGEKYISWYKDMGDALHSVTSQLISLHPEGSSSQKNSTHYDFGSQEWHDFASVQTWDQYSKIDDIVYEAWKQGAPVCANEHKYEGETIRTGSSTKVNAKLVREQAIIAFLSGSKCLSYGNVGWAGDRDKKDWQGSMNWEGANDMRHLLKTFAYPKPSINNFVPGQRVGFASGSGVFDGCYANKRCFAFDKDGGTVSVNLDTLSGSKADVYRVDMRNGSASKVGTYTSSGRKSFYLSVNHVLVVNDAAEGLGAF